MGIVTMLVVGLLAGLIARTIIPLPHAMGLLATLLLGIVGSLVGDLLGSLFSPDGNLLDFRPAGLTWSIVGSAIALLAVGLAGRRHMV